MPRLGPHQVPANRLHKFSGQAILTPFLSRPVHTPLFNPREAIAEWRARQVSKGKRRPNQKPDRRRTSKRVRDYYTTDSYRRAIANACDKASDAGPIAVPRWHPHQLRHNYGTNVRSQFGAERAQIALGHRQMDTTEIYAERDVALLRAVAAEIG